MVEGLCGGLWEGGFCGGDQWRDRQCSYECIVLFDGVQGICVEYASGE